MVSHIKFDIVVPAKTVLLLVAVVLLVCNQRASGKMPHILVLMGINVCKVSAMLPRTNIAEKELAKQAYLCYNVVSFNRYGDLI
jgi:hypothetical protein